MTPKAGGSSPPQVSQTLCHFHKNIRSYVKNECCFPRTVNISNVGLLKKYLYSKSHYSDTWDGKCLAPIAQMVRAFGMNTNIGDWSPPQVDTRHYLSQNLWHFHKNIRSCVWNKCCCPRTFKISNVNFTSRNYRLLHPYTPNRYWHYILFFKHFNQQTNICGKCHICYTLRNKSWTSLYGQRCNMTFTAESVM